MDHTHRDARGGNAKYAARHTSHRANSHSAARRNVHNRNKLVESGKHNNTQIRPASTVKVSIDIAAPDMQPNERQAMDSDPLQTAVVAKALIHMNDSWCYAL